MKTPREILLARHQAAAPQLDALRQSVVADLNGRTAEPPLQRRSIAELLSHLFHLPKPALAGLAFAWLIIIALNVASRDTAAPASSPRQMAQRPTATMQDLREQKRLFAELVGTLKDSETEVPRFVPRPRGDIKPQFIYV